jgi:hypothetical protein
MTVRLFGVEALPILGLGFGRRRSQRAKVRVHQSRRRQDETNHKGSVTRVVDLLENVVNKSM